jgi:hypothetical protein
MPPWIRIIFVFAGIGGILYGLVKAGLIREFTKNARQATGRVVDFETGHSRGINANNYMRMYYPVVVFEPWRGREIRFTSTFGTSWKRHRVGQSVPVLFDPRDLDSARIGTPASLYGEPVIAVLAGVVFLVILAVVF